ncbi:MAG: hypothetical protein ABSF26_15555 [Thermoguttaceae bacterium]|jgi:hypothetical protein
MKKTISVGWPTGVYRILGRLLPILACGLFLPGCQPDKNAAQLGCTVWTHKASGTKYTETTFDTHKLDTLNEWLRRHLNEYLTYKFVWQPAKVAFYVEEYSSDPIWSSNRIRRSPPSRFKNLKEICHV